MQAIGRQSKRALNGAPVDYEHRRPEQTTTCRLMQQHVAILFEQTAAEAGAAAAAGQGRDQSLSSVRHPGSRLPAPASWRLRPRQAGRLFSQAARPLPLVRGPAHGAGGGALGEPRHPQCGRSPVGSVAADPAVQQKLVNGFAVHHMKADGNLRASGPKVGFACRPQGRSYRKRASRWRTKELPAANVRSC